MRERPDARPGVPCWIETLQPDPRAAARFYRELLGWQVDEPAPMPAGMAGEYLTARLDGRLVAGIGQAPAGTPSALWTSYVAVERIEAALARVAAADGSAIAGPLEAGAAGRGAIVADPDGVAFGLWQAGARAGAELVDAPGAWTISVLHTPAGERAAAFYGALLGWRLEPLAGTPLAAWRLPGAAVRPPGGALPADVVALLSPIEPGSAVPPHWAVALAVADADATAARATALGGAVLLAPSDGNGLRSALIADPQRGVVAISGPAAG